MKRKRALAYLTALISTSSLQRVREVSLVSYPIMISMLTDTAIGLVDMKIVSSLNDTALGAVGIANAVLWFLQMVAFGFMRGVKVNVSLAYGAEGRGDAGIRFAQVGIGVGILSGVFLFGMSAYCEDLFRFAGVQATLIPEAVEFLRARMLGAPLAYSLLALMAYSEGVSKTKEVMYVRVFGNLVNLLLVYSMVFGRLGFAPMGIRGAGYGTSCADGLQLVLLFCVVFRGAYSKVLELPLVGEVIHRSGQSVMKSVVTVFRQISHVGSPTALSFGLDMLAFSLFTLMIGKMGELQILAHQIALCLNRVPYLLGISVGEGAAILVGQSLGNGNLKRARQLTRSALGMVCVLMGVLGVISAFFGDFFASYFSQQPSVIHQTQILLGIAAAFQVFDGLSIVLRAALRTAKDMKIPTLIGIATIWVGLPGSAFLLGEKMGLGVTGAWCGFLVKTVLSSFLLGLRWKKGSWKINFHPRMSEGASA